MGIFHGRRPISRKMSRPWNRELGWSLCMGLAYTKMCECNQGVEDSHHFFFECIYFNYIRKQLVEVVQKIWREAGCKGSPCWPVILVLSPSSLQVFTKQQCHCVKLLWMQLLSTLGDQVDIFNLIWAHTTIRDWLFSARLYYTIRVDFREMIKVNFMP